MIIYKVGDALTLEGRNGNVPCIVMQVDEKGEIMKARAVVPEERLLRLGFLQEGDDVIVMQWHWSNN